jgi:uncharacterized membrane protein YdjX (TVP38/TMEM64 family)
MRSFNTAPLCPINCSALLMIQLSLLKKRVPLSVWLRLAALVGLLLAGLTLVRFTSVGELLDQDRMKAMILELRSLWWAPLLLIGLYTGLAVLGLPPGPLMVAGALFGPLYGSVYNITGLVIGAAGSYMVAGLLGREFVVRITGDRLRRAEHLFERHGFWPLVQTRFLPIPFAVINFGAALAGVRPFQFVSAAVAGLVPSTLIHTVFIAALLESSGRQRFVTLAVYAGLFIFFNLLISALWLKGAGIRKFQVTSRMTGLMRRLIRRLDGLLRRKMGIFEYSDNPYCMFRVHLDRADRTLHIPGGKIETGTKILELHFWNEHILPAIAGGTTVVGSIKGFRMFKNSLSELAGLIDRDPRMAGVQAVGGLMPLFLQGDSFPAEKMLAHLGFKVHPFHGTQRSWRRLGKQMHGWMMMWAYNPATIKKRNLFGLQWAECWMSTGDLLRLYAGEQNGKIN